MVFKLLVAILLPLIFHFLILLTPVTSQVLLDSQHWDFTEAIECDLKHD